MGTSREAAKEVIETRVGERKASLRNILMQITEELDRRQRCAQDARLLKDRIIKINEVILKLEMIEKCSFWR